VERVVLYIKSGRENLNAQSKGRTAFILRFRGGAAKERSRGEGGVEFSERVRQAVEHVGRSLP